MSGFPDFDNPLPRPEPGSLDNGHVKAVDLREMALIVTVTRDGIADARAQHVDKIQGAEWLRIIADMWDPPTASAPVVGVGNGE